MAGGEAVGEESEGCIGSGVGGGSAIKLRLWAVIGKRVVVVVRGMEAESALETCRCSAIVLPALTSVLIGPARNRQRVIIEVTLAGPGGRIVWNLMRWIKEVEDENDGWNKNRG